MTKEIYTCDGFLDEGLVSHGEELSVYLDRDTHGEHSGINLTTELIGKFSCIVYGDKFYGHYTKGVELFVFPKLKLKLYFYHDLDLMRVLSGACMTDKVIEVCFDRTVLYTDKLSTNNHKMRITELSENQTDINSNKSFHYVGEKYISVTLELA